MLYIDDWLIDADEKIITADVKAGTVGIAEKAFYGCTNLTAVIIPDSVVSICNYAFSGCGWLKSLEIGSGLKNIGCFNGDNLFFTDLVVSENNETYKTIDNILFTKNGDTIIIM